MDIAVSVKDISKKYSLYKDPWGPIKEVLTRRKLHKDFFALNKVSLDFPKGESIGVLGKNGSGKSTLLKIITGITEPTNGVLKVNGSIVFLDVSSGIDSELSGYENIFMKGTLLGYSKEEMMEKVDDIIEFSELGEFIEQPVKNFSSGMKSKLGFAISVNVDPDILIVDEALAVGDSLFREKCMRKMNEFKEQGKTIIFVSHDKDAVESFCSKAAWLHKGELITYGDSKYVGALYDDFMKGRKKMESIQAELYYQHSFEKINYGMSNEGFTLQIEGLLQDENNFDIHEKFNLLIRNKRTGETAIKSLLDGDRGFKAHFSEKEFPVFFKPGSYSFHILSKNSDGEEFEFSPWTGEAEINETGQNSDMRFTYNFIKTNNTIELSVENLEKLEEQVNRIWYNEKLLEIEGVAFIRGYETKSESAVSIDFFLMELNNFNHINFPVKLSETEEITENPAYNPQGKIYNFSKFNVSINLDKLPDGNYESFIKYKMNEKPNYEVQSLVWASKHSDYPSETYSIGNNSIKVNTENKYLRIEKRAK
ncbi:ABC transporter ATP-binding protein [Planomicrobium okeanokoites]|uniref:ABC transporter ATP-binding protein n=1 Tax=Planomicrobium okeanokoites TaxID=244 RepID=UPI0024935D33|nr:ABC transporter ATP-binding protein [Planomicrobium okeanokoites]